jgi:hypothetical protein
MAAGNYLIERAFDPIAVFVRYDERGQELHRMACVTCDLNQNSMILAERDGDQLTEEPGIYGFQ